jgi:hypothetical protein
MRRGASLFVYVYELHEEHWKESEKRNVYFSGGKGKLLPQYTRVCEMNGICNENLRA